STRFRISEQEVSMNVRLGMHCSVMLAALWIATGAIRAQGGRESKAATPDPCALMTREDAAAALGGSAGAAKSAKGPSILPGATALSCEYVGPGVSQRQPGSRDLYRIIEGNGHLDGLSRSDVDRVRVWRILAVHSQR